MADDRVGTLAEAQIGALQAYAEFLEELVSLMILSRMLGTKAEQLRRTDHPEAGGAEAEAEGVDEQVRGLLERGASMRLTCAKLGALPALPIQGGPAGAPRGPRARPQ